MQTSTIVSTLPKPKFMPPVLTLPEDPWVYVVVPVRDLDYQVYSEQNSHKPKHWLSKTVVRLARSYFVKQLFSS
jgi:hypothetical protein